MTLPWVRIDSNIGSHDKILALLLTEPSPQRWRAFTSYICGIGYCADAETDGRIPEAALRFIHGTPTTAGLLVKHGLWEPHPGAWHVHNYALRQELTAIHAAKQAAASRAGQRANCIRWHGPGCWTGKGCSRDPT